MKTKTLLYSTIVFFLLFFHSISIKAQPGTFSLLAPANGNWVSTLPYFDWANATSTTYYQLYVDGTLKKNNIASSNYQLLAGEELTPDMHTWYVIAIGAGSTQSNETWSIQVDATQPTAFNLVSPTNNSWTTSLQPTLTWSASSDANSGLAKYQLWIDGVLNRDNISASSTSTIPISNLTSGTHTWMVKAIDNVGNIRNSTQTWTIIIDNRPPRIEEDKALTCYANLSSYCQTAFSNTLNITNTITLEAWVNYSVYGLSNPLAEVISKVDHYGLYIDESTGKAHFKIGLTQDIASISSLNTDTWYHLCGTYDGSSLKIYINGVLNNSISGSGGIGTTSYYGVQVGRKYNPNPSTYVNYFNGIIDEVKIWDYARTPDQILKSYDKIIEPNCNSGLVLYWRFNNNSGTTVFDLSPNGINGTTGNAIISDDCKHTLGILSNLKTPTCSQFIQTNSPSFSWGKATDTGIGFQKFQLYIDGNMVKDNLSDSSWTITGSLAYGPHTWFIKGYDSLGNNQSSYSRLFYIDNAKPNAFNLTTPTNNQIVNLPTPNLIWQATTDSTGGSGMRKYQLWINGVKNRDSIPIAQTTVAPSSALPQGAYTWYIKAFDNVGNIRQSTQTWTFYVDWEPPTAFTLVEPIDNATLTVSRPLFKWHHSSDIGSGLDKYELCISGQAPIVILPSDTSKLITFDLPNGNYTWYVKAYDVAGAFTSSNTHNLTINLPLPGQAGTPTGVNALCVNASNTDYTTTGASNSTSYIWEITPAGAGTISGTGLIGTVDWNNTFTGVAQITVKGHNSAGDGIASTPISVTIYPTSIAGAVNGGNSICLGASTGTLTLSGHTGNIIKWQKRVNSGTWSDISNTSTTYSEIPATVGVWEYRAEIQSGACAFVFSISTTVNVGTVPVSAGTISGNTTVCQGQSGVIYTVPAITNATSYIWTLPTGATGTSITNSITVDYGISAVSGNITVKGHNTCGDGTASMLAITVNIKPLTPVITQNVNVLHSDAPNGNQWYNTSGLIPGAINQNYTVIANGDYYVIVTLNGCSSNASNTIQITNVGIGFTENNKTFNVYPNPFGNELTIELMNNTQNTNFEILNSLGQVVFKGYLLEKTMVQTNSFAPGIYLIKLENGKTFEIVKRVKE